MRMRYLGTLNRSGKKRTETAVLLKACLRNQLAESVNNATVRINFEIYLYFRRKSQRTQSMWYDHI